MPSFIWLATDIHGKARRGFLQATSARQAREILREQQLFPVSLKEGSDEGISLTSDLRRTPRIPVSQLTLFTRQLATLVNASLPLENALKVLAQQCENKTLVGIVNQIRDLVTEGQSFSSALAQWPKYFDSRFRTLVAAGEQTGNLGAVLIKLADDSEFRQRTRNKLFQATIYPLILTLVAISVIIILLAAVVPQIIDQFSQFKQQLPLSTRILITVSDFLQQFGLFLLLALVLVIVGCGLLLRQRVWCWRFHRALASWPVIGNLSKAVNSARYIRALSIMQGSNVPLLDAMMTACESGNNLYFRDTLLQAAERVRQGGRLHLALQQTRLFPPMIVHMVASGEECGQLGELMLRAADIQENQLQNQITLALAVFEPVLVVTMSSIVLFIMLSILQPLLQLNNMV